MQGAGDLGDMPVQAALGEQARGDDGEREQSERQAQQLALDGEGDEPDNAEQQHDTDDARCLAPARSRWLRR